MATKRQPARTGGESPEPHLRVTVDEARRILGARISQGENIGASPISSAGELKERKSDYHVWDDYNHEWLNVNVGKRIAEEYAFWGIAGIGPMSLTEQIADLHRDIEKKLRRLRSVVERLPLWADPSLEAIGEPVEKAESSSGKEVASAVDAAGRVFIVHGRNLAPAKDVARMVEASTDRKAVILHEQASRGQTILEKFESNAAQAAFAVIVLTADDEGRLKGSSDDLRPRGRQNVILELGYFIGFLTRKRIAVLVDAAVEHPSDVAGLVYIELDAGGSWKYKLGAELREAGIPIDFNKIV